MYILNAQKDIIFITFYLAYHLIVRESTFNNCKIYVFHSRIRIPEASSPRGDLVIAMPDTLRNKVMHCDLWAGRSGNCNCLYAVLVMDCMRQSLSHKHPIA